MPQKRQDLETQAGFDQMFAACDRTTLPNQPRTRASIAGWIKEADQRAVITCFKLLPH